MKSKRDARGLIKALGYKKAWFIRKSAAEALGEIGDSRGIVPLVACLQDDDKDVRQTAADALEKLGWKPTDDAVGVNYWIIKKRWEQCGRIGGLAVEPLCAVLQESKWMDGRAAASALGVIGDVRAIQPLLSALRRHGWEYIGNDVADSLGRLGGQAVPQLIAVIAGPEADLRLAAAMALGAIGDPRAIGPLYSALKDLDPHVSEAAAHSLGRIGEPAVESLIAALHDSNVPWEAAKALGEIGDPRAIRPLIAMFADLNWRVWEASARALSRIGPSAVAPLLAALQDPEKDVRKRVADTLDRLEWQPGRDTTGAHYWIAKTQWMQCIDIGSPAVDPLTVMLEDGSAEIRRDAASALGKIRDSSAVEPLLASLRDGDGAVRTAAAEALGRIADRKAVDPLREALGDENWQVRAAAARALGAIGDARVAEPLIAALRDDASHVREAAAESLGILADPRALGPLMDALQHGDEEIHKAAAEALGRIGDRRAIPSLLTVLDWDYYGLREVAAAQQAFRDTRSRNFLIEELKEKHILIRAAAAEALGNIGDVQAVEPLIDALKYVSANVRKAAAGALGKIGDAQAVEPLIAALRDKDFRVRTAAIDSLVRLDRAAVGPLLAALGDENREVRALVAEVLGKIGNAAAVEPLIAAFYDPDESVRRVAATALIRIGSPAIEPLIATLKVDDETARTLAAEVLGKLDWKPGMDEAATYFWIVKRQWKKCVEIGAPAVAPLITAFRRTDEDSRNASIGALSEIGELSVTQLIAVLRDETEHVYESAVITLGNIGGPAVKPLIAALRDEHYVLCKGAAEALGIIGDPRAVEPLMVTLRDGAWYFIRKAAAEALGKIRDERAVPQLIAALSDEYFKVRDAALDALIRIGIPAVDLLIPALTHKEWRVRKAAAEALGKIGDARAIQPLVGALADEDKDVLKAAAWALVPFSHTTQLEDSVKQRILQVLS